MHVVPGGAGVESLDMQHVHLQQRGPGVELGEHHASFFMLYREDLALNPEASVMFKL